MTADPYEFLRQDPALRPLVDEHGEILIEPASDPFERLVVSIVNQQLSTASAAAIRDRLFDRFEVTPDGLLAADEDALRDVGLSSQKVRYVRSVAAHFDDGVAIADYADMTDDEVIDDLTTITGVGTWTAKMFLIFVLAREDVFPVEDLGIRRGMEAVVGEMTRAEMVDRAEVWRPYRSYASRYLWRAVD
ncbi:DNA-3-methyladenine glycosylase family protein [Halobacteriaceae archaeon GCM10025711]